MGTITVKQLIELLNKSLENGSIKNDSEVLYSHHVDRLDGTYDYEFDIAFLWDTVEEALNE